MTHPEKRRRTMARLGLFALTAGVIAATALTAKYTAIDRDESARRSTVSIFGTTDSPGVVGEFHYQLWKRRLAPAGSIFKEIDFRIRRDFTESSSPIVGSASQPPVVPLLFEVPEVAVVERELSGGEVSGGAPGFR